MTRTRRYRATLAVALGTLLIGTVMLQAHAQSGASVPLPAPRLDSDRSIESALLARRTRRDMAETPISLASLGQLLWAAQGITSPAGYRTAPSAGARYPLELYVLAGNVEGLAPGVYHYRPATHRLALRHEGDRRAELVANVVRQPWVARNAAILVFCAVPSRTTDRYGSRGERYVLIEVGHAAQNVLLQAEALALAAGVVGAFDDRALDRLLELPSGERALYLLPVGVPGS